MSGSKTPWNNLYEICKHDDGCKWFRNTGISPLNHEDFDDWMF